MQDVAFKISVALRSRTARLCVVIVLGVCAVSLLAGITLQILAFRTVVKAASAESRTFVVGPGANKSSWFVVEVAPGDFVDSQSIEAVAYISYSESSLVARPILPFHVSAVTFESPVLTELRTESGSEFLVHRLGQWRLDVTMTGWTYAFGLLLSGITLCVQRTSLRMAGRCRACGYPCAGLPLHLVPVCPECGMAWGPRREV